MVSIKQVVKAGIAKCIYAAGAQGDYSVSVALFIDMSSARYMRLSLSLPVLEIPPTSHQVSTNDSIMRTEGASDAGGPGNEILRDPEFWFPDGSIVFVAQGHGFRVYQGFLAQKSEVFKDLFDLGSCDNAICIDGCPMVDMPDSAVDLRNMLRVLFYPERYWPHDQPVDFGIVASLVRLGHKYEIPHLRDVGLVRLKSIFPDSSAAWRQVYPAGKTDLVRLADRREAITAVHLALLTNTQRMLPAALYLCSQLPVGVLIDPCSGPDGIAEPLPPALLVKCLEAKTYFARDYPRMCARILAESFPAQGHDSCRIGKDCMLGFTVSGDLATVEQLERHGYDHFAGWNQMVQYSRDDWPVDRRLCYGCASTLLRKEEEEYFAAWNSLPARFGLEIPKWIPEAPSLDDFWHMHEIPFSL